MASTTFSSFSLFSSLLTISSFVALVFVHTTMAADPDILTDFVVPANVIGGVDGGFFTFTGLTRPPPSRPRR